MKALRFFIVIIGVFAITSSCSMRGDKLRDLVIEKKYKDASQYYKEERDYFVKKEKYREDINTIIDSKATLKIKQINILCCFF